MSQSALKSYIGFRHRRDAWYFACIFSQPFANQSLKVGDLREYSTPPEAAAFGSPYSAAERHATCRHPQASAVRLQPCRLTPAGRGPAHFAGGSTWSARCRRAMARRWSLSGAAEPNAGIRCLQPAENGTQKLVLTEEPARASFIHGAGPVPAVATSLSRRALSSGPLS